MTRNGLVTKLLSLSRILQRGVITGHGCSNGPPTDPVTRLAEAHQRRLQAIGLGQQIRRWNPNILHCEPGRNRGSKRPLTVHIMRRESSPIRLDQKAADSPILWSNARFFKFRPNYSHIRDAARGNPQLFTIENIVVAVFARACPHTPGVRTEVGLSETEAPQLFPSRHLR